MATPKQRVCDFRNHCRIPSCDYFHPEKPCERLENCFHGERCRFIHPDCLDITCTGLNCKNTHVLRDPRLHQTTNGKDVARAVSNIRVSPQPVPAKPSAPVHQNLLNNVQAPVQSVQPPKWKKFNNTLTGEMKTLLQTMKENTSKTDKAMQDNFDQLLKLLVKVEEKISKDYGSKMALQKEFDELKKTSLETMKLVEDMMNANDAQKSGSTSSAYRI